MDYANNNCYMLEHSVEENNKDSKFHLLHIFRLAGFHYK